MRPITRIPFIRYSSTLPCSSLNLNVLHKNDLKLDRNGPKLSHSWLKSTRIESKRWQMSYPTFETMKNRYHLSNGSIHLIVGPMFSGKTTELFRLSNRYSLAGKRVVVVKYARDTRYDDLMVCTHDLRKMDAISAVKVNDVWDELIKHDVIGIDEGQFFDDVVECAEQLADMGKTVIIAALDGDFQRKPFPNIATLFPLAEKVDKVNAVCRCGDDASFTLRTVKCNQVEVIGGKEMYEAVCRTCYHEQVALQKKYDEEVKNKDKMSIDKTNVLKRVHSIENGTAPEDLGRKRQVV
ncbi:unnamed protein product [Bursaphelenchus okinawaensis]|uniref:Thymidine kinase n=1 Tax=Bursaphelenchus okinawaensis TaxID=465554 RepID=A0A811KQI1_9BILA|nr:unnamed protein product [Bursaphelenchus okinawaensis]CAG9111561.1 unnamed protein product [Bursaphelenchus okinawaensis]